MCGIMGWTQFGPKVQRMFPVLALEMERRGSTSWGTTNGLSLTKKLGGISQTLTFDWLEWPRELGHIFHTRAPSGGTGRTVECAHPFHFRKLVEHVNGQPRYKHVTGIHNGYIAGGSELVKKYPDRVGFDVDSMHAFKHILDDAPTEELGGSGALAWYETYTLGNLDDESTIVIESNQLYVAKFNTSDLHLAKILDDDGAAVWVFASTKDALERAGRLAGVTIETFATIESHKKYKVTDEGPVFVKEMVFAANTSSKHSYSGGYDSTTGRYIAPGEYVATGGYQKGSGSNYASSLSKYEGRVKVNVDKCPLCTKEAIMPEMQVVCECCFEQLMVPYVTQSQLNA